MKTRARVDLYMDWYKDGFQHLAYERGGSISESAYYVAPVNGVFKTSPDWIFRDRTAELEEEKKKYEATYGKEGMSIGDLDEEDIIQFEGTIKPIPKSRSRLQLEADLLAREEEAYRKRYQERAARYQRALEVNERLMSRFGKYAKKLGLDVASPLEKKLERMRREMEMGAYHLSGSV